MENLNNLISKIKYAFLLSFIPFILAAYYDYPTGDDYCYAAKGLNLGFWDAQVSFYKEWTGRYTATALLVGYPLIMDFFNSYKFIPIIMLLISLCSVFIFFKSIAKGKISTQVVGWATLSFFSIYILTMPSVEQGFYFAALSITNQFGVVLILALLGLILLNTQSSFINSIKLLLCLLLTFIISGTNEMNAMILVAILGFGTTLLLLNKEKNAWLWLVILSCAITFLVFSYAAPGNLIRHDQGPTRWNTDTTFNKSFIYLIFFFLYESLKEILLWITHPILICSTFLLLPVVNSFVLNYPNFLDHKFFNEKKYILAFLIFWISLIGVIFLIPFYGVGHWALRTLNVIYFIFLLGWFSGITLIVRYFTRLSQHRFLYPKFISLSVATLLLFGMIINSNFNIAFEDVLLTNRARSHLLQQQKRTDLILQAVSTNQKDIKVPPISMAKFPATISGPADELTDDPQRFPNNCVAEYFGLDAISPQDKKSSKGNKLHS